jgi:hypothetical protein
MKLGSVRNAVNVSTLIIAANVRIQKPIASIELSAVFGRCRKIEGREKLFDAAVGQPPASFENDTC